MAATTLGNTRHFFAEFFSKKLNFHRSFYVGQDRQMSYGYRSLTWSRIWPLGLTEVKSFKYSSVCFQPKLKSLFHFFMSASTIFDVQGHVINWFDVMVKVMAERRKESFQLYSTFLFVKFSSDWKFHSISFKIFRLV